MTSHWHIFLSECFGIGPLENARKADLAIWKRDRSQIIKEAEKTASEFFNTYCTISPEKYADFYTMHIAFEIFMLKKCKCYALLQQHYARPFLCDELGKLGVTKHRSLYDQQYSVYVGISLNHWPI